MNREITFQSSSIAWQAPSFALPTWVLAAREHYFNELSQKGFPTKKQESFRYTDLSDIKKQLAAFFPVSSANCEVMKLSDKITDDSIRLVFHDQQFQPALSDLHLLPDGVIACDLQEALTHHEALLKAAWPVEIDVAAKPLAAFTIATLQEGFFLYVPPSCNITQPLHLLHIISESTTCAVNHLQCIHIDKNSQVAIFEEVITRANTSSLQHQFNSVLLNEQATLNHCLLGNQQAESLYWRTTTIQEKKGANASFVSCLLNGKFARHDLSCQLQESFANCKTSAFYHVSQSSYIDHHIEMQHLAPHTESDMLFKGTLTDAAKAVFNGRVYVEKNAQKINAHQANHHLLFSDQAESYSKPELEIYADDVKCKHGATTAAFDDDAIFYCRSRGLSENSAKRLLLNAFLESILHGILLPPDFIHYIAQSIKDATYDV